MLVYVCVVSFPEEEETLGQVEKGLNHSRAYDVHPYLPRCRIRGRDPCEPDNAVFRSRVGRQAHYAVVSGYARQVDDAPAVSDGDQLMLQAVEGSRQIDVNDTLPVVERDLCHGHDLLLEYTYIISSRGFFASLVSEEP